MVTAKFRLMELTPELLQEIESGNDLVIRGDEDDSVVVCTENATYDLKMCTTRFNLQLDPLTRLFSYVCLH